MLKSTNKENIFLFNTDIVPSPTDRVQTRANKHCQSHKTRALSECFNLKECLNARENFREHCIFVSPTEL